MVQVVTPNFFKSIIPIRPSRNQQAQANLAAAQTTAIRQKMSLADLANQRQQKAFEAGQERAAIEAQRADQTNALELAGRVAGAIQALPENERQAALEKAIPEIDKAAPGAGQLLQTQSLDTLSGSLVSPEQRSQEKLTKEGRAISEAQFNKQFELQRAQFAASLRNQDRDFGLREAQFTFGQQMALMKAAKPKQFSSKAGKLLADIRRIEGSDPEGAKLLRDALVAEGKSKGVHVNVNTEKVNEPLSTATRNAVQKNIIGLKKQLNVGFAIMESFEADLLRFSGKFNTTVSKIADFFGPKAIKTADKLFGISPAEQKRLITATTQIRNYTGNLFNQYRKETTGTAASVQELREIKKVFVNPDTGPTEFIEALRIFMEITATGIQAQENLLHQGITLGTVGKDRFVELFDAEFDSIRPNFQFDQELLQGPDEPEGSTLDDELLQLLGE